MRPEYDGVKFYSKEDFGSAWALQKAEPTLASFNADGDYNDINKVFVFVRTRGQYFSQTCR